MTKWYLFANLGSAEVRNGQVQKALALRSLLAERCAAAFRPIDVRKGPLSLLHILTGFSPQNVFCISLGQNGLRVFALIYALCCVLKGRQQRPVVVNFVVGGWLAQFAASRRWLLNFLQRVDTTFVETEGLAAELRALGVRTSVFPNFRMRLPGEAKSLSPDTIRLCFCSRIRRDKGPLLAIDLAERLNASGVSCSLDFYGVIETDISAEFSSRLRGQVIRYLGSYRSEAEAIDIMSRYDFSILPTSYPGECVPGAVIESFCAGTPAIVSDWRFMREIVDHRVTGIVARLEHFTDDAATELHAILRAGKYPEMSRACLGVADRLYSPAAATKILDDLPRLQQR
jgi:glycosyltransferase involved in cell wall biosynthesis